jgi:hypothetical protein
MFTWIFYSLCSVIVILTSLGCTNGFHEFVQGLNDAKVSNCVFVQGSFPPYGNAYLYAKAGELDCMAIWNNRLRLGP